MYGVPPNLQRIVTALTVLGASSPAAAGEISSFTQGDLVISTVTNSTGLPTASALDTASPITLQQFSLGSGGTSVTAAGALTLPQTTVGANSAISGEYGSASEGFLQLSGNGQYLTMIGYGVNANTFNTVAASAYGTAALGQTTSLLPSQQTGTVYTTVPRVVALIGANASVDTSTALTGVFNTNNPRSAYTYDGSTFYVSGQGEKTTPTPALPGTTPTPTQGVWLAQRGATTATPIDNSTDTRFVTQYNGQLYVSRDVNPTGSGGQNYTNISKLTNAGGGLPTSSTGLVTTHLAPGANSVAGNNGSITLNPGLVNGVNNSRDSSSNIANSKNFVYLSPEQYFFASPTVMYVADSGQPKNGSANAAALGEGGLQKWALVGGVWTLQYDLVAGLNLVNNANANANTPTAAGVTGLFGLTGQVVGNQVELFATSYGLNELSPSYLYEITDTLSDTTIAQASGETFTTLLSSSDLAGASIRGVSFAPVAAPGPTPGAGLAGLCGLLAAFSFGKAAKRNGRA